MIFDFCDAILLMISNFRAAEVSDCGKYLIMAVSKDCRDSLMFFSDLEATGEIKGKLDITQFVFELEADYDVRR